MANYKAKQATAADVRAWARANGIEVSQRGLIAEDVIREFNRAKNYKVRYDSWKSWEFAHAS